MDDALSSERRLAMHWLGARSHRNVLIACVPLMIFACQTALASTYYIAPNGSDSNSGSEERPFRTLSKGVSKAHPGDTILLEDGTYGNEGHASDGSGCLHGCNAAVSISSAGTADHWITVKAQHKWGAVLDCGTVSAARLGCDMYIYLRQHAAYWSFQDLVVTHGAFGGITSNEGAWHIEIKGCRIENIGNFYTSSTIGITGIGFNQDSVDWRIEGNVIHDIGRTGGLRYENHDHGIYANGSVATIVNNVFYGNTKGWAIQTSHGANQWLIANNTFAFSSGEHDGQIVLWDGDVANSISAITIRNNIFYNPGKTAIVTYTGVRTTSIPSCQIDHNVTNAPSIYDGKMSCEVADNRANVDPRLVNPATAPYDFHLQPGSPAIGWGSRALPAMLDFEGLARPANVPIDAGAYQYHRELSRSSAQPD